MQWFFLPMFPFQNLLCKIEAGKIHFVRSYKNSSTPELWKDFFRKSEIPTIKYIDYIIFIYIYIYMIWIQKLNDSK